MSSGPPVSFPVTTFRPSPTSGMGSFQAVSVNKKHITKSSTDEERSHQRAVPFPARIEGTAIINVGFSQFSHCPNNSGLRPIRVHESTKSRAWTLTATKPILASILRQYGRVSFASPSLQYHQA